MTNKKITEINLNDYRTEGAKVYTGRDRGLQVREESDIVAQEQKSDQVNIRVPEDIYSINPSFLEEFLRPIVEKLGKEAFYKKIHFNCDGLYDIQSDLEEAVERILRKNHALV